MKKHTSKLIALVLVLCLCLSLSVSAFAAEIDSSGGSGSTPVNLSSTSDGTEGGDPSATAMRVTVPTALPMAMSQDGDVTTANNCQIVNHSYGAVRVKSVSITAASGWKLTAFGNKSILAGEKVDSNKLGFAISIGGGQQKATDASNANTQTLIDAPIAGCYMTGVGDSTGNTVKIDHRHPTVLRRDRRDRGKRGVHRGVGYRGVREKPNSQASKPQNSGGRSPLRGLPLPQKGRLYETKNYPSVFPRPCAGIFPFHRRAGGRHDHRHRTSDADRFQRVPGGQRHRPRRPARVRHQRHGGHGRQREDHQQRQNRLRAGDGTFRHGRSVQGRELRQLLRQQDHRPED